MSFSLFSYFCRIPRNVISYFVIILMNLASLFAQPIKFDRFTTEHGLSQSTITCILQDSKGFMWFGTQDGLNKYDGYNFTIFRHDPKNPNSVGGNSVFTICEDNEGILWIGTDGGLDLFNKSKNEFINYKYSEKNKNSLSNNYVVYIFQDSKDNLWIATNGGGLNLFDKVNNKFIHFKYEENNPNSISSNDVYTIFEDSKENLWIGTWQGDLDIYDRKNKSFKHLFHQNEKLSNNIIRQISEGKNGNIWIATHGDGLYKLIYNDISNYEFEHYLHNDKNSNSIAGNAIFSVFEDSQKRLWIGTENDGLNLYDSNNNKFTHFKSDEYDDKSISHNSIWSIYEDRTGNIWFGTYAGGINLLPRYGKYFKHFKHIPGDKNSLSNNSVTSFLEDSKGIFWVGTDGGGLNIFDKKSGNFKCFNNKNSNLSSDAVLSIFEDSKNNLWVGTWAGGLNLFNKKSRQFISYSTKNSNISSDNIFSILEDSRNRLWLGSHWGGLSYFDQKNKQFINYTPDNSALSDNHVRVIYEDSFGNLWVGGNIALNLFNTNTEKFTLYTHDPKNDQSISKGWILSIFESSDSTLWIGTSGGLNKFYRESELFIHYTLNDGLPNDVIKGIREDSNGNLWLSTNKGLSRFNPHTETFKNFDISDGLQGNEFYNYSHYSTDNGELYFGGVNGFNYFHPQDLIENPYIPPVILSDFKIFNKRVDISKDSPLQVHINDANTINLSYKHSVFSFGFTALNYISSEKNQYAYKLEGFDKDWNYIGTKNNATYTNLDPGEYIFKVKGSNNDEIWNEKGTTVKLIIAPPFWQTLWFRLLILFSFFALIYLAYKYRVRKIEAHRRELEKMVDERTHELKEANQEIVKTANQLHKSKIILEKSKKETDNILQNVKEGFFLLDHDLNISSQYSLALETIFCKKNLAKLNFPKFINKHIEGEEAETINLYLDIIFDSKYDENAIKDLNPLVDLGFNFQQKGSKIVKYLNFTFKRIKEKKNKISEIIVTVKDVTQEVLLSQKLKSEEERKEKLLQLILSILDIEPGMLTEFNESTFRELKFIDQILNREKIKDYNALLVKIYRAMHLIKGNAKLLNIDYFAEKAHEFEDKISELQKKSKIIEKDLKPLRKDLKELHESLNEMEKLIERISKVYVHKDKNKLSGRKSLLKSLENLINEFSNDLGKKIKFNYKNFNNDIFPDKYHLLVKEVLIQLVRNSISHGIETPKERTRFKKPQFGTIEISTFKNNGHIGFKIKDDGKGIKTQKIKEVALNTGKWKTQEIDGWSDDQIADLIFQSGITTSENVNMISGRGVGMDGVKHRILEHKGDIKVNFEANKFCEFEISLPV